MGQYNLGSLNNAGGATQVVAAGDPPTLILNHSTKNTVYIGNSSAIGSGNLLDATPLDPYSSIVVNGVADVWAIAADTTEPATVYTYQNAVNWTPKAIQPNIVDPHSPLLPGPGTVNTDIVVPPTAQGLFISWGNPNGFTGVIVNGLQSGIEYASFNPTQLADNQVWVPILSDADTAVRISTTATAGPRVYLVWIMSGFMAGPVDTAQTADVNIANVTVGSGFVPVEGSVNITGTPNVIVTNEPFVYESNKGMYANQEPLSFNQTLNAGATAVLLPASAGVQYNLHTLWCQINSSDTMSFHIQDTGGNDLGVFINTVAGAPANAFRPPNPQFDFKGSLLPVGVGVQLKNGGAATEAFVGCLTYSK